MKVLASIPPPAAHLLIVDDSAEEQYLLMEMLRGHDFQMSGASGSLQAYDLAVQTQPDMIVMNLQAAGEDALPVERRLRENPRTVEIPVLFLATAKHLSTAIVSARSGLLDYLIKPFTVAQLNERVHAQLRLSSMLRENRKGAQDGAQEGDTDEWQLVRRVKDFLEDRLSEPVRLIDIAQALSLSERRLAHAFQSCMSMSVAEYLRQERMRKAKHLLMYTTLSMRIIAQQVGFSSAANFSTAFNSWVGASPSSFRSQALTSALALDRVLSR